MTDGAAPFTDDLLPSNYVPFNVQAIGDSIVVTYEYLRSGAGFSKAAMGWDHVDVRDTLLRLSSVVKVEFSDNEPRGSSYE
jgi:hypothetical protein